MKTPLLSATAVALLALTACQSKTTTTVENTTSATANETAAAPPISLPSIKSEASYRCHGDNSLVHVTFYDDDKSASVQSPPDGPPVSLKADTVGKPLTADGGWSLTGDAKTVKLTQPGKAEMSCDK